MQLLATGLNSRRRPLLARWLSVGIVAGCLGISIGVRAQAPGSFKATLDRTVVPVGESATLTLTVEGAKPTDFPSLPVIPNLQQGGMRESQNFSIVNGRMSATVSRSIELMPLREGDYVIPALSVHAIGTTLTSPPLTFQAVTGGATQLAFLKLHVPKKELYVGEV